MGGQDGDVRRARWRRGRARWRRKEGKMEKDDDISREINATSFLFRK